MAGISPRRCDVVLAAFGGPSSLIEVEGFVAEVLSNPRVLDVPSFLRPRLARFIARRRVGKALDNYSKLGGASPLPATTRKQVHLLQKELDRRTPDRFRVHLAFLYCDPRVETVVADLQCGRSSDPLVIPLFPQKTFTGYGTVSDRLAGISVRILEDFRNRAGFVDFFVRRIEAVLAGTEPSNTFLFFTAHSIPVRHVKKGDCYPEQIRDTVNEIMARLRFPNVPHVTAFQSRFGPVRWVGPTLQEAFRGIPDHVKDLVVVPVSFVGEHLETLVDLDLEFIPESGKERPEMTFHRIPAPTCEPDWIAFLADLAEDSAHA